MSRTKWHSKEWRSFFIPNKIQIWLLDMLSYKLTLYWRKQCEACEMIRFIGYTQYFLLVILFSLQRKYEIQFNWNLFPFSKHVLPIAKKRGLIVWNVLELVLERCKLNERNKSFFYFVIDFSNPIMCWCDTLIVCLKEQWPIDSNWQVKN